MPVESHPASRHPVPAPSDDQRWRVIDATMRLHGYTPSGLIESLHKVQESFGYLNPQSLLYVARSLSVPLSKAYGVATFYNVFRLKPQGEHLCAICTGTACHIKGAPKLLTAAEQLLRIKIPDTTADQKISVVTARCVGPCGIAPVAVFDGAFMGQVTAQQMEEGLKVWLNESPAKIR